MKKTYIVTETCSAMVKTTYIVEAESPQEAETLVRCGNAESEDEEVYGHEHPTYHVEEDGKENEG